MGKKSQYKPYPTRSLRPDGQIRRSQVVTTFGPGAIVDLVDHSVIVGGLEWWHYEGKDAARCRINEPRLRDALVRRGWPLSAEAPFRTPPLGPEEPSLSAGIEVLEFPEWFVCQAPRCRELLRARSGLTLKSGRYVHDCNRNNPPPCVPVRFVGACKYGHIDDFPWPAFAHGDHGVCASPRLQLLEGPSGDFSEVRVWCRSCGAPPRALSNALAPDAGFRCWGRRPWLGSEGNEDCDGTLRLLVRTASNTYFPQIVSALSIPDAGRELEDSIRREWDILQAATAETLPAFRAIPKITSALGEATDEQALAVIEAVKAGHMPPREPLRTAELKQLRAAKAESPGDSPPQDDDFFVRLASGPFDGTGRISSVVLAHKLREVRAQVGFTRIEPVSADLQGELDLGVELARLTGSCDWLPAYEVKGEGVLVCLDEDQVVAWENREEVLQRGKELLAGYLAWITDPEEAENFPGVRFYLLHSLSHLLISAISLECGYAASAIRERIYCSGANSETPMAAVLLSTGTAGSEGTLGGLVEQGRRLGEHLRRAFDLGRLCSNDPVCAGHSPKQDPAERYLEGAACHGCLYIAEPSCERFNRYLDRTLVVPTLGHPEELPFFSERP